MTAGLPFCCHVSDGQLAVDFSEIDEQLFLLRDEQKGNSAVFGKLITEVQTEGQETTLISVERPQ